MKGNEIPNIIESNTVEVDFGQLHNDFSKTEYGKKLFKNVRYEQYKPENVSKEEWHKLLGADVNNLEHLKLTYGLTRQFISHLDADSKKQLTKEEKENLLLAATVHDWAEAVVGDINYDHKTKDDEEKEYSILNDMIDKMYGTTNPILSSRIKLVIHEVIKNPETKLGKMFNAVERIGYLRTSLNAWKRQKDQNISEDLKQGLSWITNNVLCNQTLKLIEYSTLYKPVNIFLTENKELISEAFNNLQNETFSKYKPEEIENQKVKFNKAKSAWQIYYSNLNK